MTNEQDSLQPAYNHAHVLTDKQTDETPESEFFSRIKLALAQYDYDIKKRAVKENMDKHTR